MYSSASVSLCIFIMSCQCFYVSTSLCLYASMHGRNWGGGRPLLYFILWLRTSCAPAFMSMSLCPFVHMPLCLYVFSTYVSVSISLFSMCICSYGSLSQCHHIYRFSCQYVFRPIRIYSATKSVWKCNFPMTRSVN